MKREIKFRAWNSVTRSFMNPSNLVLRLDGHLFDRELDEELHHVELMQFTGLKDKKGEDIYEGDVIEYDNATKAKVIFKDGGFCGYDGYASSSDEAYFKICPEYNPIDGYEFDIQVIGNIHQMRIL